jgi:hypothetical protein
MSVTILPSRSNIEISNAQQIETIETLEMKIEATHVARALFIAWKYLSGRHFVLFIYWSATLWAWLEMYEPFHFGKKNNNDHFPGSIATPKWDPCPCRINSGRRSQSKFHDFCQDQHDQ